jgi:amino acid adenylation domain-containing protein
MVMSTPQNVEDIYPLSPAQQGMLLYLLLSGAEVYFDQYVADVTGPLDPGVFRQSWLRVIERHPPLRTLFLWEKREQPLQVVRRAVELPWQDLDWSGLAEEERGRRLEGFLAEDKAAGFDLGKAPLMRVALIRWGEGVHKIVWSFHHLVLDGWSMSQVLGEALGVYESLSRGQEVRFPRPRPFRDYIRWIQKQDLASAESFWRRALAGHTGQTPIPFDGTGSKEASVWVSREELLQISKEKTLALDAFARGHQVTLNTLLQGVWGLVLARSTGLRDVVFGSVVSGRPPELEGVESMVGMFINSLPVRVEADPGARIGPLLRELQARQIEQRDYEHCPLEQIQAWCGLTPHVPVFEALLVFENYPHGAMEENESREVQIAEPRLGESNNFPVTLYVFPLTKGLQLRLNHHWSRVGTAAARLLLARVEALMDAFLAFPDATLADLFRVTEEERRELLAVGTGPATGPAEDPVLRLFEAQAARTPEAVAVESKAGRLTYAELESRATALARHLRSLGVGPESIVGLCAERSPGLIVAMLGIWKAGGAYLPLDPAYPRERLAFMLEDSGARVVLTQEKLAGSFAASSARVVLLDADWPAGEAELPAADLTVDLVNGAYVIYTSGSTGRPKGVLVPHASLANYVRVAVEAYGIGAADRVLQFASVSFDTSAEEIYPALTTGATLVLRDEEMVSSLERFARETGELGVTVLDLPTAYWHELVAEMVEPGLELPAPLRLVILGGEQAQADRLASWRERVGERIRLVNSYGPTEATIVSTHRDLTQGIASADVPIGRAIPNARTYVVDRGLELVPAGVEGELLIGGAGLARGYLGRPDLTAERFVPDAFGSEAGARLYRTGDLVRLLPDGDLQFRGRADDQVKVRGFRIELGEIEAALRRVSGVRDAVVAAREDGPGGKRLVAYVVPSEGKAPATADLRSALKDSLPEYMVPSVFVTLEALPATPSGKVDRRALPAPDAGRPDLDASYEAPRNPVQEVLAGIWADLLGVDRVGVHDDFFQLGGHSLLVAKLAARVRQAFKVELSLIQVFQNPTVAALAERIERPGEGGEFPELPPIRRVPRDRPIPLSFPQERVWFLDQLTPGGNIAYNFQVTIWFEGALRPDVFRATLQEIVRRHEVLRTSFPAVDGLPVQVVHEPWLVELPVADLRALPEELRFAESERLVFESTQTPFDVARLPLLRWRMLRLADDLWELIQVEQHFVHDGWSFGVMLKEIKAIYTAFLHGEPSPLPELPVQYADFAAWQRELMEGGGMEQLLGFWKRKLAGSSTFLELPTDRPRPNGPSFAGDITLYRLPVALYESLRAFSRREGFTLYMTMLAGFFALLNRYTGQEDILLGTNNANRRASELEGLLGMMVNTLVVRGDLSGNPDFRTLLGRAREVSLETYAHQDTPFERLVQELRPERQPGRNPLFQVMFNFHDAAVPDLDFAGLHGGFRVRGNRSAKMDMNVIVVPGAEQRVGLAASELDLRAVLHWEYNTDLFDFSTVQRMIEHFRILLGGVIENPRLALSELPLLSSAEQRQLVTEWNDTGAEIPDRALHELFEATAARTPEAVAISFEGETLTYGELDARANRLARHLRRLGVGAETLVGLSAERSPGMLLGLLAVLKAGGAYVPLDPTYPADRLAYVVEDAKIPLLLTEEPLRRSLFADSPVPGIVEIDGKAWETESAAALPPLAGPENRAYVIYTSGSTGRPKGVEVRHRAAVNFLASMARRPGLAADDVLVAVTTLSFDIALLELFLPLAVGARIELAGRETAADGARLATLLADSGATAMQATPATWRVLLESGWEGSPGLKVLCGGEALPRDLADRLLDRVGSLWNVYGPTETTVWSALHRVAPGDRPVPVGQPVANTTIHILDRSLRPAPVNVLGELYIGGEGLARGYLGRPDLTAERFVPDPFGPLGARLYRTGDVARRLASGDVEFAGRADHQVKVRGFRIELGEIEAVLASHPAVRQCAVVVREEGAGDRRLVAYLVAGEEEPRPRELRAFLAGKLPDYMVPGALVVLPELPLTPNGKVDRRALSQWAAAPGAAAADEESAQPRSPVEEVLAAVFADLLGRERVGIHDSFFEQGGHSLLATRAVSRVRDALGVEIPLRAFFAAPSVSGLAGVVERARSEGGHATAPPIVPVPREGVLPVSFAQRRLWFLDRLAPESSAYNLTFALRLGGSLDLDALRRCLEEIVRRHETLRTRFAAAEGEPVQIVSPPGSFTLPLADLSALADEARERETSRLATAEAGLPFDLAAPRGGSLLRATLLKLAPAEHAMLLTLHHIVADGWSLGIFIRELGGLYTAFASGSPSPFPELPVQYADFAAWQRSWLAGGVLAEQLDWWRGHLDGAPAALELPVDRPRPAVQTHRGGRVSLEVPREAAAALEASGWQRGVTPFMTLFSAFAVLLSRYSGQSDLVIGIPIANRGRSEVEDLIGLFANTLALRADLGGDPLFPELTARVREAALGAYAHQDLPFEKLVDELRPERSLSHSPLFQVMLTLQNMPLHGLDLPGLALSPLPFEAGRAQFELSLLLVPTPSGLAARLDYNSDLFDRGTAERMARHFGNLLSALAADPARRLSEIPLLSEEERREVLAEWNRTAAEFPRDVPVHRLVLERAARTPEAPALSFEGGAWTYGDLAARAGRLARRLREQGIGPERVVALVIDRSPELVAAALGVLQAGGAYLPIDPASPEEWTAFLLADSGASAVLTREDVTGEDGPVLDGEVPVDSGNLAYVIYTSGSTGRPKGVQVSHGSLANLAAWYRSAYGVAPEDRVSLVAGPGFDASVFEMWPALTAGACLVIPAEPVRLSPERLAGWLREEGTTLSFLPTPLAEAVLDLEGDLSLPALRAMLTGGDRLHRIRRPLPFRLVNHYGPTEATVVATCGDAAPGDRDPSIGRPIANTTVYLLGPEGQPVPPGAAGELYLGGEGVARGYAGRPDLTAERFVPDPFAATAGARLYRTGDLTRFLPGGEIAFLGRTDHQVKIRGHRIEPGEIESVLAGHPAVKECAVVAREDRLVAWFVPSGAAEPRELRSFLAARLSEAMVPSVFIPLDALPLTPNGKVDRRDLSRRPLPAEAGEEASGFAEPRGPVEEAVAGIWAALLGRERVGVHDNFFALGGHSLLATRVVSRVRDILGAEIPLRALFEEPTVAGLASVVERARRGEEAPQAPPIRPVPRAGALPLSFAQQRLWFLDQLEPESSAYVISFALHLDGRLDRAALGRALTEIVRRHETLRTRFVLEDGDPLQAVAEPFAVEPPAVDLSGLPEEARESEALRLATMLGRRPMDLAAPEGGSLLRVTLLKLAESGHAMLISLHHIAADGWSMGVFLRELGALYAAFAAGRPAALPALPVQYADFAAWQRGWLAGEVLEVQLGWWHRHLAGAPPVLDLPTDRPRPAVQTHRGERLALELPRELSAALEAEGWRRGVTPFMTLFAAFSALLSRASGQEDLVIGTPIANRNRSEVEDLIGLFANTLALRADLGGDPAFADLALRVREAALGAYAHQDLPFEKLVDELEVRRDLSHSPLFQVLFTLQNTPQAGLDLPGIALARLPVETGQVQFDLTLNLAPGREGLVARFDWNADLFDRPTVERLAGWYRNLIAAAAADPSRPLSALPLLAEAERRHLLVERNGTGAPVPECTVHSLFEETAARLPREAAVSFEGESLTYEALNARANRLAHHLRRLGVGPEVPVGLYAERSLDMLVGLLAVLKAGGAYVPLDPAYPAERLAWVAEDARIPVLLTQRRLAGALPGLWRSAVREVEIDAEAPFADERADDLAPLAGPESLAYVLYTSGSTGRPKGVEIRHRAVVNFLLSMARRPGLAEGDAMVAVTTLSFDIAVLELLLPLSVGARIELVGRETAQDPERLAAVIEASGATALQATPATWRLLLEGGWEGRPGLKALCGGEALPRDLADLLRKRVGSLWNVYGPTETTVWSAVHPVGAEAAPLTVPIGRPIANTALYLVDPRFEPVLPGAAGELLIGGLGLARGYRGRPDLTAERFVPDPFGASGARLYRTGDLVRLRSDGEIEFLGRADHQVKVRGFRIELGEIEAVLAEHPGLRRAVVMAREGAPGERRLAAWVVPAGEAAPPAGELRAFLEERLPEYMVPSVFVPLAELPLTPNGKVDRRALPEPERGRMEERVYTAPRSAAERVIAAVWAEVLRLERVGVDDNFFELGGDSILSIRVVVRSRKAGVLFTPAQLFQHQTVAALARVADASGLEAEVREVSLSPFERRVLESPAPGRWNEAVLAGLPAGLEPERAEAVLQSLADRHESLRLRFHSGGREVGKAGEPVAFERVDLSAVAPEERNAALLARAAEIRDRLDPVAGPVLRAAWFHLGEAACLLLVVHRLAVDGPSLGRLLAELAGELSGGEPAPVPLREEREVSLVLGPEETRALLESVPALYGNTVEEVLLAAALEAFGSWTGSRRLDAEVELDVPGSGTVEIPVRLETAGGAAESLKGAKEGLREALRHTPDEPRGAADVFFRFRGRLGVVEPLAPGRGEASRQPLEISAISAGGRLRVDWTWDERIHRPAAVRALAESFALALRSFLRLAESPEAGGFTPSDFLEAGLDQRELDDLLADL